MVTPALAAAATIAAARPGAAAAVFTEAAAVEEATGALQVPLAHVVIDVDIATAVPRRPAAAARASPGSWVYTGPDWLYTPTATPYE